MGDCMSGQSNVARLPACDDLDKLGRYAALTVMASELARLAVQGAADEVEITLNGERQMLALRTGRRWRSPKTCLSSGRRSPMPPPGWESGQRRRSR